MAIIDLENIPAINRTSYPAPYSEDVEGRWYRRLAPVAGLTRMGASHVVLKPQAWSSQRHWHAEVDELLVMLSGEAVLVEDKGETTLRPGDIAAWPAGVTDGHCLHNRSASDCCFVVISAGNTDVDFGEYPDIDMKFGPGGFTHRDGTPYA